MALSETQLHRRVGAVGLLVLVTGVVLFLTLDDEHLRPGLRFHVELERTGALVAGAPVVVAGREVGSVDDIRLVPRAGAASYAQDPTAERAAVVLDVWIDRRWAHALHENSELFQNQPSILAEAYLEIGPPRGGAAPGPPLRDGATVRGANPPRMDQIAQRSYENLRNVIDLIRNGFPEARALGRELALLSAQLDALAAPGSVDALAAARARLWFEALAAWDAWQASGLDGDDLARVAAHARVTLARTRAQVAALRAKIDAFVAGLDGLRAQLGAEKLARFAEALRLVDELSARADTLLAHAEEITAMVVRGEGTIGAFLNDPEMADEFKALTKVLKERPWEMVGHPQR